MQNALRELKRIEIDALYGKKAHFNAADRKRRLHKTLGVSGLVVTVVAGSSLFGAISNTFPAAFGWIALVLTLVVLVLTALQTFFSFDGQASAHAGFGSRFVCVARKARRFRAYADDDIITAGELRTEIERLATEYADIIRDTESNPYSSQDYKRAQEGFKEGEEEYTAEELAERA